MSEARPADAAHLVVAVLAPLLRHEWLRGGGGEARKEIAARFTERLEEASSALVGLVKLQDGNGSEPGTEVVAFGALRLLDALRVFVKLEGEGQDGRPELGANGLGELYECTTAGGLSYHLLANYVYTLEALVGEECHV